MKKIVLLYHQDDRPKAKALLASLRRVLDTKEHELWSQDNLNAFGAVQDQLINAITDAWVVLVLVGSSGVDAGFQNLARGAVMQEIADQGSAFGRLRIDLPGRGEFPKALMSWPSVSATDPLDNNALAQEILNRLELKPQWSIDLNIDVAVGLLDDGASSLREHLTTVAQDLKDGKPLTLLLGPYAGHESPPSGIKAALLGLINDQALQQSLAPTPVGGAATSSPHLWQDHLATICLLSNRSRADIETAIGRAVSQYPGDESGPPEKLFGAIADFAQQLEKRNPRRDPGLPAVTIITVCPGLRMERALISRNCVFERVSMLFGAKGWDELDRSIFEPEPEFVRRAANGERSFLSKKRSRAEDDDPFVRLVKLGGTRDLYDSIATDLGQSYLMLEKLQTKLEAFVSAAGKGPYLTLGGGLTTPPLQAAHALLLRNALQTRDQHLRLALIPPSTILPDPFWHAEAVGRLDNLVRTPQSGFDRMQIVSGSPTTFLQALCVAFGGSAP
jgi:hypothetical protein